MAISLKRKLYSRGGSFETTIPMQLLFSIDINKKNNVLFDFDKKTSRWYITVVEDNLSVDHNELGFIKKNSKYKYKDMTKKIKGSEK